MEMAVVNKSDIPQKPKWDEKIFQGLKEIKNSNGKLDTLRFTFKRNEKTTGLETSWRRICKNHLKKTPHVKTCNSVLGKTLWLTWD